MGAVTVNGKETTFALIHQINGYSIKGNSKAFNSHLSQFLFKNSSTEVFKDGPKKYDPKSPTNDNIPEWNLNVTISEIKK